MGQAEMSAGPGSLTKMFMCGRPGGDQVRHTNKMANEYSL